MVSQDPIVIATDYLSGFQYVTSTGSVTKLEFFPTAEGYVEPTETGGYQYVYNYTDHLGNNRLSYTFDTTTSSLQIREENNYYPFGLKHKGYNNETINSGYQYQYNGKEWQDELGLTWYDYGARNYDASLGRWMNVDPLAEQYRRWSPYNYAVNNPIRFIDPDGMGVDNVIITGDLADKATEQLNKSSNLQIEKDENGKLKITGGEAITDADKKLQEAIESDEITVNLLATSENILDDGSIIIGGAFEGSKTTKGLTEANQIVNPNQMDIIDAFTERGEGVGTLHEVLEAFVGAENSNGKNTTKGKRNEKAYKVAHKEAEEIDSRHVELNEAPLTRVLDNGNGTKNIYQYIKMKGKTAIELFREINYKN